MARDFSAKEAKTLIKKHESYLVSLTQAKGLELLFRDKIKQAVDVYAENEVLNVLAKVPVEELNRDKKGIRVKSLADDGYVDLATLHLATEEEISDVNGISDDTAFSIKKTVNRFADSVRREIKLKLSIDNRDEFSTEIVRAVSIFKNGRKYVSKCKSLLKDHYGKVTLSIHGLMPGTKSVGWLFVSKKNKAAALTAYNELNSLLNGEYGAQANELIDGINAVLKTDKVDAWEDFSKHTVEFYNILEEIAPEYLGADDTVYGLPEELALDIQKVPVDLNGLKCTLRRYQELGLKYILHQGRVLLGDEMGLGKTIQAIAAMVSLRNSGATHFLVICPASVLANWRREITKHSDLDAIKIHGADRASALKQWIEHGGVGVTTYETTAFFQLEEGFTFAMAVVDEAHYIKNPQAMRSRNTKKLCKLATNVLFMTGTALENDVDEMISLISALQPKIAAQVESMKLMAFAPQFRQTVAPVYYRRKRDDVLKELPDLIENEEWCEMTAEEERVYESCVLEKRFADARRVSWNAPDLKKSSKAARLLEIVEDAQADNRKIIVFSFFLDTVRAVCRLLGDKCVNPINGSLDPNRRQEIIDEFDAAPAGSVLPAQIQSGGTGLNIQSASVVVICEPQFKPSTENQAISRAYRMGQSRNVLVYRLLCEDTVDESVTELLKRKQSVFDAFADESVAAADTIEIDESAFGDVMERELERIREKRGDVSPVIEKEI